MWSTVADQRKSSARVRAVRRRTATGRAATSGTASASASPYGRTAGQAASGVPARPRATAP